MIKGGAVCFKRSGRRRLSLRCWLAREEREERKEAHPPPAVLDDHPPPAGGAGQASGSWFRAGRRTGGRDADASGNVWLCAPWRDSVDLKGGWARQA